MLRVALIGLGDIARKAYLPVLAARADVELHLVTRRQAALAELGDAYRIAARSTDVGAALTVGVDAAFVHAATTAHDAIVARLLDAGIPTYVDKPLTDRLSTATALVEQAERLGVSLMVGFNRRYAPAYSSLLDLPARDLVVMQKHRNGRPEQPRRFVFDDFIHVVDTLRFLAPGPVEDTTVAYGGAPGLLAHVSLHLRGRGFSCFGAMHRGSGATEETLEVTGGGRRVRVVDVGDVVEYDGTERLSRRDPWVSVGETRGFAQACEAFLSAVREGRLLSAADALETHALCERVVAEVSGTP